jgi:hypothetical protein
MSWHLPKTRIKIGATDVSLFFGLPILAYSEIKFGTEVLGLPHGVLFGMAVSLAYFVPGFLDVYVITAMRRGGKEVGWALGLVIMSVTGGSVAHLYKLTDPQKVMASAVFGCMLAVVIWRVKTIAHADSPAAVAAQEAAAQLAQLTTELDKVKIALADRDRQVTAAADTARTVAAEHEQALQKATDQAAALQQKLTDAEHRHELAVVRLRGQLDTARAAAPTPGGNVVPLHRGQGSGVEAAETTSVSDATLLSVLNPLVKANPKVGRPAATEALRSAGLACGTERLRELLALAKAEHQIAQAGASAAGDDQDDQDDQDDVVLDDDVAVSS